MWFPLIKQLSLENVLFRHTSAGSTHKISVEVRRRSKKTGKTKIGIVGWRDGLSDRIASQKLEKEGTRQGHMKENCWGYQDPLWLQCT